MFSEVLAYIASLFKTMFNALDSFKLVGDFSILDFGIAVLVIDIIITSFVVTYNVGVRNDNVYSSPADNQKPESIQEKVKNIRADFQANYNKYGNS